MSAPSVLIVEDDPVISENLEEALGQAGYDVCGVAVSEDDAIEMATRYRPGYAVVDVRLAPGSGLIVSRALADRFGTTVLMASCEDPARLNGIGAAAAIRKPYAFKGVPVALETAHRLKNGENIRRLPFEMTRLKRD